MLPSAVSSPPPRPTAAVASSSASASTVPTHAITLSHAPGTTPSLMFGNLAACAQALAYAHKDTVHVVNASALDGRAPPTLRAVTPKEVGAAVTHVSWVQLARSSRPLLAVTSREAVTVFAPNSAFTVFQLAFHSPLVDIPALGGRPAGVHFLRGVASIPEHGLLLVGTSWGDVLVLRAASAADLGEGATSPLIPAAILTGAHAAAITSIAADERCVLSHAWVVDEWSDAPSPPPPLTHSCIVTADDLGVVAQWAVPTTMEQGGSGGKGAHLFPLLVVHDKSGGAMAGSPCSAVGLTACGGAILATFADGVIRVYRSGSGGGDAAATTQSGTRFMEAEVAAHTRAAMALAVHPTKAEFATAGADGVVCVWSLPELPTSVGGRVGRVQLERASRVPVASTTLTGLAFVPAGSGGAASATALLTAVAYDSHTLTAWF